MQKQALVKPWLLGASLSLPFAIGAAEAGDLVFDITYVDVNSADVPDRRKLFGQSTCDRDAA